MNKATEKALRGSMRKWELIVVGEGSDEGYKNCPLCAEFFEEPECYGCPVSAKTGLGCCDGTPYEVWHKVYLRELAEHLGTPAYGESNPKVVIGPLTQQAAIDEYNFLASLLP